MEFLSELPEDEFPEFVVRAFRAIAKENLMQEKELRRLNEKVDLLEQQLRDAKVDRYIRDYEESKLFRQLADLRAPKDEEAMFYVRTADGRLCVKEAENG